MLLPGHKARRPVFWTTAFVLAAAAFALAFRLPQLARRPMHQDEAVHAVKAGDLIDRGEYVYDPYEFHGPTLYYFALPAVWLSGARSFAETNEVMFRIVPVLFGTALILLLLLTVHGLGRAATAAAAALTALSPAMVFYSRYFIQETLLVFFSCTAIACGWRFVRSRKLVWALAAGASLGLMHATKETCAIIYAAMAAGLVCAALWSRLRDGAWPPETVTDKISRGGALWRAAAGLALGVFLSALMFSACFTRWEGFADSFRTYYYYFARARHGLHIHPWDYYLRILIYWRGSPGVWWSEGLIVGLALVGFVAALWRKSARAYPKAQPGEDEPQSSGSASFVRFLAFYTLFLTAAYCAIPYKTPWCVLGFLHGMILLAGFGAAALVRAIPGAAFKGIACAALAAAAVQLGGQAYRANYVFAADPRNPYVYSHTSTDFLRLAKQIEEIAGFSPEGHAMRIHIVTPDYWPLPWYLRRFSRVGYWFRPPRGPDAPIIITSLRIQPYLEPLLQDSYHTDMFGLRPHVLIAAYTRSDLWDAYIASRTRSEE